jgi:hypothetical protein
MEGLRLILRITDYKCFIEVQEEVYHIALS